MAREIKFRAKDAETGEWLHGSLIQRMGYFPSILHPVPTEDGKIRYIETCVDKNTIGQFTGLKDREGYGIWENDIVKYILPFDKSEKIRVVRFSKWFAAFALYNTNDSIYADEMDWLKIEDIRVIGNVHDNPELVNQ